jgi:hypothetical protein
VTTSVSPLLYVFVVSCAIIVLVLFSAATVVDHALLPYSAIPHTHSSLFLICLFFSLSPSLPLHLCGNGGITIHEGEMKEKVVVLRELLRVIIYTRELSKQAIEGHVSTTIPLATMRRRSIFHPEQ